MQVEYDLLALFLRIGTASGLVLPSDAGNRPGLWLPALTAKNTPRQTSVDRVGLPFTDPSAV